MNGPFCPEDETFLARYKCENVDPEARRPESDAWIDLDESELLFTCLKCRRNYDLTGHGDFENVTNILLSLAHEPEQRVRV